jgi:hypothetical protein
MVRQERATPFLTLKSSKELLSRFIRTLPLHTLKKHIVELHSRCLKEHPERRYGRETRTVPRRSGSI